MKFAIVKAPAGMLSPCAALSVCAALSIGLLGCDTAEPTPEVETVREVEVERVDPEADVEVMPSGEVDVGVEPTITE